MMKQLSTAELKALMDQYSGGSEGRYRHWAFPRFIYTDGVKAVADAVGAYWLLDTLATEVAAKLLQLWASESIGTHFFEIKVEGGHAHMAVCRDTGEKPVWTRTVSYTDFPDGQWVFELAIDGLLDPQMDVVVMLLLQEH